MAEEIMLGMTYLRRAGLEESQIAMLERAGYLTAPASKGHHLCCRGGLLDHSVNVTNWLVKLTETMGVDWNREESPYLVGMLHDLVKVRCYRLENEPARDGGGGSEPARDGGGESDPARDGGGGSEPTRDGGALRFRYVQPVWPGHGTASVLIATAEFGIDLDEKETAAIVWHMGAFGLDERGLREYDAALSRFPQEIIAAHTADMLAARVDEEWRETPSWSSAGQDGGGTK